MKIKLSTYVEGEWLYDHYFFILNKGHNSGKPRDTPWCNSFVASFETLEDRDHYYWLCYGLWITGKFRPMLRGSVIDFITKQDLLNVLDLADSAVNGKEDQFIQAIGLLHEAERKATLITTHLAQLQRAKLALVAHFIHI